MISRSFQSFVYAENFYGVNAEDTPENMLEGEWDDASINIFSDPQGALGSRPGFSALTTASIGTSVAWTGFFQFDKHASGSTTSYFLGGGSDGKLYKYESNAYTELYKDLTTGVNVRWSFFTLNNIVTAINGNDQPLQWAGTGSATTFATTVTSDFGIEWQRYGWLHSTVDPRLVYYTTTLGDPTSAYTSNLNFDMDGEKVIGLSKQGDDMLVGKRSALYRVQYRGTTPLFKIYRVPSKIGPVCHWVMKELPDGRVIFLANDYNFYMVVGDNIIPVGKNIRKYIKSGVNSRLPQAVSGLLYARSQYWCSFTYTSGATTNDRTVVMDWSRPYQDKFGKLQYPWFIYSIGANAFAEVNISGQDLLYHGDYAGRMHKDDTGTNDNGSLFISSYKSKFISHGDPTVEKKWSKFAFSYENKGSWNLDIAFVADNNANTQKITTQSMSGGIGGQALFDVAIFDVDSFSSESDADVSHDIDRQGKTLQITLGTDGLDESWLVHSYSLQAKALRRGVSRIREG